MFDINPNTHIEIITKSMIRYSGTHQSTSPQSITLTNVKLHGTEDRKCLHFVESTDNMYNTMTIKMGNIDSIKIDGEWKGKQSNELSNELSNERKSNEYHNKQKYIGQNNNYNERNRHNKEYNKEYYKDYNKDYKEHNNNSYNDKNSYNERNYNGNNEHSEIEYESGQDKFNKKHGNRMYGQFLDTEIPESEYVFKDQSRKEIDDSALKQNSKKYYDSKKSFYDDFSK